MLIFIFHKIFLRSFNQKFPSKSQEEPKFDSSLREGIEFPSVCVVRICMLRYNYNTVVASRIENII